MTIEPENVGNEQMYIRWINVRDQSVLRDNVIHLLNERLLTACYLSGTVVEVQWWIGRQSSCPGVYNLIGMGWGEDR